MMHRRHFLQLGGALPLMLAGCGSRGEWPEGMQEIKWDRDTCQRCRMVISDRRFAVEMRGGPQQTAFKFDDIGCALVWLQEKQREFSWLNEATTAWWVADANNSGDMLRWHAARRAFYFDKASPMGYNMAAVGAAQAGAVDFAQMRVRLQSR